MQLFYKHVCLFLEKNKNKNLVMCSNICAIILNADFSSELLIGERKDQERLERLKAERQEKINELKEKTNYYITQQLIQVGSLSQRPM